MSQSHSAINRQAQRPADGNVDPIAEGLRQLYRNVAEEPIPDEFLELLNRIDSASIQTEKPANEAGR